MEPRGVAHIDNGIPIKFAPPDPKLAAWIAAQGDPETAPELRSQNG